MVSHSAAAVCCPQQRGATGGVVPPLLVALAKSNCSAQLRPDVLQISLGLYHLQTRGATLTFEAEPWWPILTPTVLHGHVQQQPWKDDFLPRFVVAKFLWWCWICTNLLRRCGLRTC